MAARGLMTLPGAVHWHSKGFGTHFLGAEAWEMLVMFQFVFSVQNRQVLLPPRSHVCYCCLGKFVTELDQCDWLRMILPAFMATKVAPDCLHSLSEYPNRGKVHKCTSSLPWLITTYAPLPDISRWGTLTSVQYTSHGWQKVPQVLLRHLCLCSRGSLHMLNAEGLSIRVQLLKLPLIHLELPHPEWLWICKVACTTPARDTLPFYLTPVLTAIPPDSASWCVPDQTPVRYP